MIIQKVFTAEPDVMVTVLLFAAFYVWWGGAGTGRTGAWRWIAVGFMLGLAGLTKGPQPIGYFTLGVGAFLAIERRWRDLPGFVLAHLVALVMTLSWYLAVIQPGDLQQWITHSRLNSNFLSGAWFARQWQFVSTCVVEFFPGLLLLVFGWTWLWRERREPRHQLAFAAMLYAVMCTAVLLIWPGSAASRYAMPAVPALAVLAGILFDEWKVQKPRLIATALTIGILVTAYGVILGWVVMPLFPDLFQKAKIAAQPILRVRAAAEGPLYVVHETLNNNLLVYVPAPIRDVPLDDITKLTAPSLAILTPDEVERLKSARPDLEVSLRAVLHEDKISHLIEIRPWICRSSAKTTVQPAA
jgi:4-amino-4-deoxy-L-arabinose transferase-like glycosyltransferase